MSSPENNEEIEMTQNDLTVRIDDSNNESDKGPPQATPGRTNVAPTDNKVPRRDPRTLNLRIEPTKLFERVPPYTIGDPDMVKKQRSYTSDNSIGGVSVEMTKEEKHKMQQRNMTSVFSCIYFLLLIVTGSIIFINFQSHETKHISELFFCSISLSGMAWLIFFHFDLYRYKKQVLKNMDSVNDQMDRVSDNTDIYLPEGLLGSDGAQAPYSFLTGRHSGSFYLKTGLAAFCFGHLINEGLQLGQQVLDLVQADRRALGCGQPTTLVLHAVRPIYSFYQLFIVFKYSNIVINRHKSVAYFALMHIMGTCLCYWFGTIVEDAMEDYHHKLGLKLVDNTTDSPHRTSDAAICSHDSNASYCACASSAILSVNKVQAIPYLYPFTIEFNILLAGVWFIVWNNIGKVDDKAHPHHFQHKIHRIGDIEEIRFQSNLVISADCHASNKGIFLGLFVLLSAVISTIVFFVAMNSSGYRQLGMAIHFWQVCILTVLAFVGVVVSYRQLSKLDFNKHPITFLDDVLLFVPLPFYFVQTILNGLGEYQKGEYRKGGYLRILMSILGCVQVIMQTPMIIDGLRRCSNSQALRYKKPGREVVTFLLICNLTLWIINTFEAKSVESHYGHLAYYGETVWLFVSHTTMPLVLFYRFHSSVCLADIWKSAYEKGD
ncbi:hypothetical protein JTE90_021949 [Oedothorax gibbosus]|uniref:Otopetrin-2 n=1 Tax=Oedothorax gibbosus TaxID=931172 RepID=A0AAV6V566_9ARAC|nr:hypothetical protein JTE90_021949 [Oedothorax gibbosus]